MKNRFQTMAVVSTVLLGLSLGSAVEAKEKPKAKKTGNALMNPKLAEKEAPKKFKIEFETTQGKVVVESTRAWAPKGVDRLYNLVQNGYFKDVAFFRVLTGFVAQFGIHGDPKISKIWKKAPIKDDPVKESNTEGMLTFATAGANTRTTQMFFNLANNKRLDAMSFAPIGKIVTGLDVIKKLHAGYGEGSPMGRGPAQGKLQDEGNAYLKKSFPKLDYIKSAKIVL